MNSRKDALPCGSFSVVGGENPIRRNIAKHAFEMQQPFQTPFRNHDGDDPCG